MANHEARHRGWRWPEGIVNRILLVIWSLLLALHAWELAGCLFFGRSTRFRQPWAYDVAIRVACLAFVLALFLVPFSRRRYRLLLPAHLLSGLTGLLRSTALWLPLPWLSYAPAAWGLLSCAAAALWVIALLRGERWDEFMVTAPLSLLAALFLRRQNEGGSAWPPVIMPDAGESSRKSAT